MRVQESSPAEPDSATACESLFAKYAPDFAWDDFVRDEYAIAFENMMNMAISKGWLKEIPASTNVGTFIKDFAADAELRNLVFQISGKVTPRDKAFVINRIGGAFTAWDAWRDTKNSYADKSGPAVHEVKQ